MSFALLLQVEVGQGQGGFQPPEARGRVSLLSFMQNGPMEDTQVLTCTSHEIWGSEYGHSFLLLFGRVLRRRHVSRALHALQDLFSGQQDGLDADLPAAALPDTSLEGGLQLRLDLETQPEQQCLHLRLDSETHASADLQLHLGGEAQADTALQPCLRGLVQGEAAAADEPPGSQKEAAQEEAAHGGQDEEMAPASSEEAGTPSGDDADAEAGVVLQNHFSHAHRRCISHVLPLLT